MHARTGPARKFPPTCPTPIPTRRRAAGSSWACWAPFDSLNPFIVKGLAVQQIRGYVIESLMARGNDEPFTLYGLLAQTVETDDARTYVTFRLNPLARVLRRQAGAWQTTCCSRGS